VKTWTVNTHVFIVRKIKVNTYIHCSAGGDQGATIARALINSLVLVHSSLSFTCSS
jgi:hypothetical protein